MGIIDKLLGSGISTVVSSVSEAVDRFVTTDKEREELKIVVSKALTDFKTTVITLVTNLVAKQEEELTKRLQADMGSDSWLSKNIRPLALVFILTAYTIFSISSITDFKVSAEYVKLLGEWGSYIMAFYFTGRSVEKIVSIAGEAWKEKK